MKVTILLNPAQVATLNARLQQLWGEEPNPFDCLPGTLHPVAARPGLNREQTMGMYVRQDGYAEVCYVGHRHALVQDGHAELLAYAVLAEAFPEWEDLQAGAGGEKRHAAAQRERWGTIRAALARLPVWDYQTTEPSWRWYETLTDRIHAASDAVEAALLLARTPTVDARRIPQAAALRQLGAVPVNQLHAQHDAETVRAILAAAERAAA